MPKPKSTFNQVVYANLAVALLGIQGDTPAERSRRVIEISILLDLIERVWMTAKQANALANGLRGLPQMLRGAKETKLADKMEKVFGELRSQEDSV